MQLETMPRIYSSYYNVFVLLFRDDLLNIIYWRMVLTHGRWGGVARVFIPPPTPKAKKLTLQVYRPRNQNQNL